MERPYRRQRFSAAWLEKDEFRSWLQPVAEEPYKAQCVVCNCVIVSQLASLYRHSEAQKHVANLERYLLRNPDANAENAEAAELSLRQQTLRAELVFSGFFAASNISFNAATYLNGVVRNSFPDSQIAKRFKLGRTKMTAMVTEVIGATEKAELQTILESQKFSVLVDETTDASVQKAACIVVRYYDEVSAKLRSSMWDFVSIYDESDMTACAADLYQRITDSLTNSGVSLDNVIGYASDGCNTMMGSNNSVASRFIVECPGIVVMQCLCHSFHLCASNACKTLPDSCESLCKQIYAYFKHSAKRQNEFKEFQAQLDLEVHKILRLANTRWLSLEQVVDRILEQWDALRLYFTDQWLQLQLRNAETIFNALHDPFMQCYFFFLSFILTRFNDLNLYFQSERVILPYLHEKTAQLYISFLRCFMKYEAVTLLNYATVDPNDESLYKAIENMTIGNKATRKLREPNVARQIDRLTEFRKRIRQFYVTGAAEMRKRLDLGNENLKSLACFQPENALSDRFHATLQDFSIITDRFDRLLLGTADVDTLIDNLNDQWNQLPLTQFAQSIVEERDVAEFWKNIRNFVDPRGNRILHDIGQFALDILCLPHSNAECERVFSKMSLVKTKLRNKLNVETVKGTLLASQNVKKAGGPDTFVPSQEMIGRCNQDAYSFKRRRMEDDNEERDVHVEGDGEGIDAEMQDDADDANQVVLPLVL